jgi:Icc-related predicted phosphoesterase
LARDRADPEAVGDHEERSGEGAGGRSPPQLLPLDLLAQRHLPDFGEPSLRAVYAETTAEVEALDEALRAVATCPIRLVVLHYSPVEATLEGEPREIFTFLGSDRLAAPILEHGPDLVVHGHAHAGSAEARIGEVPVYNVSMPLNGSAFRIFEVEARWTAGPIP